MKFNKITFFFVFLIVGFLLIGTGVVRAANWYCPNSTSYNVCNTLPELCTYVDCIDLSDVPDCDPENNCECKSTTACGSYPGDVCEGAEGGWNYRYGAKCYKGKPDNHGDCEGAYYFKYNNCNAGDRCEDPSVGNNAGDCGGTVDAGTNTNGHILAGRCNASYCPDLGCRNGGWYKTCCKYNDNDGSNSPSVGDTLTGEVSPCSNCRNTDCCSNNGGVCVWGTDCTAGAALSSQNFCWYLGSAPPPPGSTPTSIPTQPTPPSSSGSYCGWFYWGKKPDGSWGCINSYSSGCQTAVGACEKLSWSGTTCTKKWDLGCGGGSPALPYLITADNVRLDVDSDSLIWRRYVGGEMLPPMKSEKPCPCGDDCVDDKPSLKCCWGFFCAKGAPGVPESWRKYELFITQEPNVSRPNDKKPEDWGRPAVVLTGSNTKTWREMGREGEKNLSVKLADVWNERKKRGTYYWFVRACSTPGGTWGGACNDSPIRKFSVSPPPACTLSGPTTVSVGTTVPYCVVTTEAPQGAEIWKSPTTNREWTKVRSKSVDGCSETSFTQVGTYYLVCNAFASDVVKCSGNPWCPWPPEALPEINCDGWVDCTANDVLTVTVTFPDPWFQTQGGDVYGQMMS